MHEHFRHLLISPEKFELIIYMAEPDILCIALPVESKQINANNVQIFYELVELGSNFSGGSATGEVSSEEAGSPLSARELEPNSSGSEATFRVSNEGTNVPRSPLSNYSGDLLSPSELVVQRPPGIVDPFPEKSCNTSYVCSIVCKIMMIGSIASVLIILILYSINKRG